MTEIPLEPTQSINSMKKTLPSSVKMFMTSNRVKMLTEINNAKEYLYIGVVIRTMEVVKVHLRYDMHQNVLKDLEPVYILTDKEDLKHKLEKQTFIKDLTQAMDDLKESTGFSLIESRLS